MRGNPDILGMPPGIPNTTGGIADAYLERKRREQASGGPVPEIHGSIAESQGYDWNTAGNKQKGGGWQDNINTGHPAPSIHGSIAAPQGGGQPQTSVTGPSREEFWKQKYAESAARKQQDQERRDTESKRFEQTRNEVDARSRQAFLDNMQRNFDMMTPQQRMQNAAQFQSGMDKWQSEHGDQGFNTRSQGELFNRIADGIGSNQGRQFQTNQQPQQFNDQPRSASEYEAQHRQRQKDWMDNRSGSIFAPSQASRKPQGPEQKQELPMFGQEGYGDMIRQRRQQQGNSNSLEALRQRAASPQQRIATNKQYPTGSQFAGTRPSTRTGSTGLNTLSKQAKPRMSLPQLYRK